MKTDYGERSRSDNIKALMAVRRNYHRRERYNEGLRNHPLLLT